MHSLLPLHNHFCSESCEGIALFSVVIFIFLVWSRAKSNDVCLLLFTASSLWWTDRIRTSHTGDRVCLPVCYTQWQCCVTNPVGRRIRVGLHTVCKKILPNMSTNGCTGIHVNKKLAIEHLPSTPLTIKVSNWLCVLLHLHLYIKCVKQWEIAHPPPNDSTLLWVWSHALWMSSCGKSSALAWPFGQGSSTHCWRHCWKNSEDKSIGSFDSGWFTYLLHFLHAWY